ncbi:MAG: type III-A CRISPR-associated RAMP protein Csm4 [Bacillota bacterium]
MKIYKLKIKVKSSNITPWQSDTIFGSLCWALSQKEGEESLNNFLAEYEKGQYSFVVSDGFPGDYLPKPMAGNLFPIEEINKDKAIENAKKAKRAKKTNFVTIEEFNKIINNGLTEIQSKEKQSVEVGVMHNQISRLTDTTEEGGLYELQEVFWQNHLSIFFTVDEVLKGKIIDLFEILAIKGFGKRAAVGKGSFTIDKLEEFTGFNIPPNANSFVTLSNYVPKANDPVLGQYKTFVKYGKLGQDYAYRGNPFKKPLLMILPGAVFWTKQPQLAYGRLVKKISPQFTNVIQSGCTLAIPSFIDKPEVG